MSISYKLLLDYLDRKGLSVNHLYEVGIITDNAAQNIRKGKPVSLKHIDSICNYLNLPIEKVVEITYNKDELK